MLIGKYILSLDQGTTSSRAVLFDAFGGIAGMGQQEFPQIYPQPGFVEHDAVQILNTTLFAMRQAVAQAGVTAADIAAAMDDGPMRNKSIPLSLIDMRNVDYFERLRNDYKARLGNVVLSMCKDIRHSEMHENRRVMRVNDIHRKIRAKHQRRYRKDLLHETQSAIGAICHQERANFLKSVQQHERDIEFEKLQGNTAV